MYFQLTNIQQTEWCYNYHDPVVPHACNTQLYPTPEEQTRFIRAYARHRPFKSDSIPTTPALGAIDRSLSSISTFMLDSRYPTTPTGGTQARDLVSIATAEEEAIEEEVKRLRHETTLWRAACSAHWIAWGIVQAKLPGVPGSYFETHNEEPNVENWGKEITPSATTPGATPSSHISPQQGTDPLNPEEQQMAQDLDDKRPEDGEEDEEFDYLGYAHERAMFFWGDMLRLGIVKSGELPEELEAKVRIVDY